MNPEISVLGCGWLGLPLAAKLVGQGWQVNGSTTTASRLDELAANGIRPFLLTVKEQVEAENASRFFSAGVLLINIPPGRRKDDVQTRYPRQIKAILEMALKGQVRKILFVSTTGVYGNTNGEVTEDVLPAPDTDSGKAVWHAEQLLEEQPRISLTILRMAGLVGGDRRPGRWFAGKSDIPNGSAPVNLVHRDDCIAIISRLLHLDRWGGIYNVCADRHPEKARFYTREALREQLPPPDFQMNMQDGYKIISNEKLKANLGYTFIFPDPMQFEY